MSNYTDTLDFEVVKAPIKIQLPSGKEIIDPKKVALINDKTGDILSYMTPGYRLFTNEEFMELTNRVAESTGYEVAHYGTYKGGKKVLSALKMNGSEGFNILGHSFESHVVLFDSRDGSKKLSIGGSGQIHRCDNMFRSTDVHLSVNHNRELEKMVSEFSFRMEMFRVNQDAHIQRLERLADIKVNRSNVYDLIGGWTELERKQVRMLATGKEVIIDGKKVSTRKTNIVTGLMESWDIESKALGMNGFGLHNMVTHYFSNNRKNDMVDLFVKDFGYKERETIEFAEALK